MNESSNTPATDAVKSIHQFLQEATDADHLSDAALLKELARDGVDIKKMASAVMKKIAQAKNRARLIQIREERIKAHPSFADPFSLGKSLIEIRDAVNSALERFTAIDPQLASVYHRKLENTTDEDLASLLSDILLLEEKHKKDEATDRR